MLTIVTWLWKTTGWRNCYTYRHVNALERMIMENLDIPHKFVCVTDQPKYINCKTIPIWEMPVVNTLAFRPNCYVRLKAFAKESQELFGERFASIDLDCVITGNVTPIFDRKEDFIIMKGNACPYNGSLWMMNAGARSQVWTGFNPRTSPLKAAERVNAKGKKYYGSDQAIISMTLGEDEATFGEGDGVYQYWHNLKNMKTVPDNTKLVFFAGEIKPWNLEMKKQNRVLHETYERYLNGPR